MFAYLTFIPTLAKIAFTMQIHRYYKNKKGKRKEVMEFVIVFIVKIKAMANPFDFKISSDLIIGLKNNAFISLFLMEYLGLHFAL